MHIPFGWEKYLDTWAHGIVNSMVLSLLAVLMQWRQACKEGARKSRSKDAIFHVAKLNKTPDSKNEENETQIFLLDSCVTIAMF